MKSISSTKKQDKANRRRTIFIVSCGFVLLVTAQLTDTTPNTPDSLHANFVSLIAVWTMFFGLMTKSANY